MDYYYVQVIYKYIVNFTSEIYELKYKCFTMSFKLRLQVNFTSAFASEITSNFTSLFASFTLQVKCTSAF